MTKPWVVLVHGLHEAGFRRKARTAVIESLTRGLEDVLP